MKLADVIDLELQLAADEALADAALRKRDRGLYRAMAEPAAEDGRLLSEWLAALRAQDLGAHWSAPLMRGHRLLRVLLVLVGVVLGWGMASGLLHFEEGGPPVNVGHYLAVVVFGQLALLLLLGLGLLLRGLLPGRLGLSEVGRLLRFLADKLAARLSPAMRAEGESWGALYHRVRSRFGLYRPLEQALILSETQLFGVAFNVGLLLSCVRLVLLSDLAFGWSTSVASLSPEAVHMWTSRLALPFSFLGPEVVPSRELVEATQYFRLDGRFAGAAVGSRGDAQLAGTWWSFLLACTVTYGLLPRLLAFFAARVSLHRAEVHVPLDTPAVARVLRRLRTPELSTRAPQRSMDAAPAAGPQLSAPGEQATHCVLVTYRDVPTSPARLASAVGETLGLRVDQTFQAGGFDAAQSDALLTQLAQGPAPVVLVTEAWEAPDKGLRNLLAALRKAMGERQSLWVVLLGEASAEGFAAAHPEDVALFRDRLTLLSDPYLRVEALPAQEEVRGGA